MCGQVFFMKRKEVFVALCIAASAVGVDFVSGRAIAAFYGQMGSASWLGIAVAGLVFGLINGAAAWLSRRTGSDNLRVILGRVPGGGAGGLCAFLYGVLLAVAGAMLLCCAGHMGALALPLKNAAAWGMGLALLLAASIALSGKILLRNVGTLLAVLMVFFDGALMLFGQLPSLPRMHNAVEFRLQGSWPAALLLAIPHAAAGGCMSAGVAVRLFEGSMQPLKLGILSGGAYMFLAAIGNAVLQSYPGEILSLELPFVALAGGWGSTGFFICSALIFYAAVIGLAGILHALGMGARR